MRGKFAWSCSAKAFEASRNEHLPQPLRRAWVRLGVACFWTALALEGRAFEVWREQRAQRVLLRADRPAPAWTQCWTRIREALERRRGAQCHLVLAWSLPDSPKMRGLGLGRMWTVLCPYCDEFHTHSPGEGRRTPHCCSERDRQHYLLEFAGALPVQYRTRFYSSSRSGLPRFMHRWSEPDIAQAEPARLLAA
jgi:hypothetical protein